jgi:hypothetical protein
VPTSDRDLPWLHIVHHLLLCPPCLSGRRPVSHFCSDMLLLTDLVIITALTSFLLIYGFTPQVRRSPVRFALALSPCSRIHLVLRSASGYTSRHTESLLVGQRCSHRPERCEPYSFPRLPCARTPVPSPLLQTRLLPWTVWVAHVPLSFGFSLSNHQAAVSIPPFMSLFPGALQVGASDFVSDNEILIPYLHVPPLSDLLLVLRLPRFWL